MWADGSVRFPFGKNGSGILVNCSLCGAKAISSFPQAYFVQSFPPKSATFCKLSVVTAIPTSLPLLFSFSSLFPPHTHPSFLSSQTLWQICLFSLPLLSGHSGSPDTHFLQETTPLMSWSSGLIYFCLLQSFVASHLLPLVSTYLFSRTAGVLSHLNSSTQIYLCCRRYSGGGFVKAVNKLYL